MGALLLGVLLAAGVPPPDPPLAITGVTVIDATGAPPRAGWTVVVRDGRIAASAPRARSRSRPRRGASRARASS